MTHEDPSALVSRMPEWGDSSQDHDGAQHLRLAHEELGQRLAAISLATLTIENGGDLRTSLALIKTTVEEAKGQLRALRLHTPDAP